MHSGFPHKLPTALSKFVTEKITNGTYFSCIIELYSENIKIRLDSSNRSIYEYPEDLNCIELAYEDITNISLEKKIFIDIITVCFNNEKSIKFNCWGGKNFIKILNEAIDLSYKIND